jgi:hypothetical protein
VCGSAVGMVGLFIEGSKRAPRAHPPRILAG